MSGDDTLPPTIPKRARTAVKRPDPIETKNRMKGKMNNLNKRSPQRQVQRAASEKEKEVAEALFDLANLAGSPEVDNGYDYTNSGHNKRGRNDQSDHAKNKVKGGKGKDGGLINGGAKGNSFHFNKAQKLG